MHTDLVWVVLFWVYYDSGGHIWLIREDSQVLLMWYDIIAHQDMILNDIDYKMCSYVL